MNQTTPPPWKALREATGLSQREIARRSGIESGRLSTIERGLIPTEEERQRLMAALLAAWRRPRERPQHDV